jgi:predicted secreted protein
MNRAFIASTIAVMAQAFFDQPWILDLRDRDSDDERLMVVEAGESFHILVESMPTTGYMWSNNFEHALRSGQESTCPNLIFIGELDLPREEEPVTVDSDGNRMTRMGGHKKSTEHSFTTAPGETFYTPLNFAYVRPWEMGSDFPTEDNSAFFESIQVIAKDSFAYDIELLDQATFNEVIPDEMEVQTGDWIRLVLNENPTTGYRWGHDASSSDEDGATVRAIFDLFQRPDAQLIGAGGKRIFVFEVLEGAEGLNLSHQRFGADEENQLKKTITFKKSESSSKSWFSQA